MALKIRDYRPGDETGIRALFEKVFGSPLTSGQWRWKYHAALEHNAPPVIAVDTGGRIVGHAGAVRLRGTHHGETIPMFQICDVMVDPVVRGHLGNKNLYTRIIRRLFDRLGNAFPNAFSYGFPGVRPFKLGKFAGVYESIERAYEIIPEGKKGALWLTVTPGSLNDATLDRLWSRLGRELKLGIIRDRAYIGWRYGNHPVHEYRLLNLSCFGRRIGWAIYREQGDKILLVDLLCHPQHLATVVTTTTDHLRKKEGRQVVFWIANNRRTAIDGAATETEVVVTNMVRGFALSTAEAQEELYYTMGDLDIF